MLTLYIRPGCPFCRKVLETGRDLGIAFELKSIENPEHEKALLQKGGKRQVPYLVDEECGLAMYESDDIIAHLRKKHGAPAA